MFVDVQYMLIKVHSFHLLYLIENSYGEYPEEKNMAEVKSGVVKRSRVLSGGKDEADKGKRSLEK